MEKLKLFMEKLSLDNLVEAKTLLKDIIQEKCSSYMKSKKTALAKEYGKKLPEEDKSEGEDYEEKESSEKEEKSPKKKSSKETKAKEETDK